MKIGIVGLPLSGKTTLFNALTGSVIDTAVFAGGKAEAHHAIVKVPDARVEKLNEIFQRQKKILATIEYLDLAGLSTTEPQKSGFSDQFLGQIRLVDAILVLLRSFRNANIPHPLERIDPPRDMEIIKTEFILSDLAIVENRIQRLLKQMRTQKSDQDVRELALLERFKNALESETQLRSLPLTAEEQWLVRGYQFLTLKPQIIVLNIDESDIRTADLALQPLHSTARLPKTLLLAISAQIEMEIQQLSDQEAAVFRNDLGITTSAMERLIRTSYDLLDLISFFTIGDDEVRAWTIQHHTKAPQAAGEVHSDIERGFIRAEVVGFDDFIIRGSLAKCKTDGVLRLEGKEYIVRDGDIINFRFAI